MKPEINLISMYAGLPNRWEPWQQKFLLDNHKTMYIDDIAEYVGRGKKATEIKAQRMGCSYKSKPKVDINE